MIEELDEDNSGDIDLKEFLSGLSLCSLRVC
jgi:Ca2+-binding EF-hand superfamily protein